MVPADPANWKPQPAPGGPERPTVPDRTLLGHAKRIVRIVTAFILILVGALFGLVPLIPGWPLALLGLSMLAIDFVWARRMMRRLKEGASSIREAAFWRKKPKPPTG